MAESTGESLNIVEDFTEFLGEYESTTRGCFDNTKQVLANIINKSNLIDLEKYIGVHLNKLQSSIDYLVDKCTNAEHSFEEHDPVMGQSMQNRFEKESINPHVAKFSSSVGFRDIPPRHRNRSRLDSKKQSPDQRSTSYSRWGKGSECRKSSVPNAASHMGSVDEYYKTNNAINNCRNIVKILFMN